MKRLPLLLTVFAALGILASAGTAHAVTHHWKTSTKVPAGLNPNDLHITYTGTGGSISNIAVTPAPNSTGTSGGGNTIDITWAAPLAPGTDVTITFDTLFPDAAVNSGTWTNSGTTIGSVTATNEGSTAAPGASPLGMLLVALAVVATGSWLLMRRKSAVA